MQFYRKNPDVSDIKPAIHIKCFFKILISSKPQLQIYYVIYGIWLGKYIESEYDVILLVNHLKKLLSGVQS